MALARVEKILTEIKSAGEKFEKACQQSCLLEERINALMVRYERSRKDEHFSLYSSCGLQIEVLEGVSNMYYEYAKQQRDLIQNLQQAIKDITGLDYELVEELFSATSWF